MSMQLMAIIKELRMQVAESTQQIEILTTQLRDLLTRLDAMDKETPIPRKVGRPRLENA